MAAALDPLGTPPAASNDYVSAVLKACNGDWGGMHLNDTLGDCTIADSANQIILHTANAGSVIIPSDDDVKAAYFAITGGSDVGCQETDVCAYMKATGLAGQKSDDWGSINQPIPQRTGLPLNINHVKWCIQLFGACRFVVYVDSAMVQLFEDRQPWVTPPANPEGHDILGVNYDATYCYCATWNGLQPVAWSLILNPSFAEEAHCELWFDWIRTNGASPSGFDLNLLDQYLKEVDA